MREGGRKLTVTCAMEQNTIAFGAVEDRVLEHGEIHLWYAPISNHEHQLNTFLSVLDVEEKKRADRFVFEKDRSRFIVGHALLRKVLGYYTANDPTELSFERGRFGKPFLKDHPLIHFNFSDTKDAILVGVSVTPGLGVDLETFNRNVDHSAVSKNYFTDEEQVKIKAVGVDARRLFLTYWTRKEAILKASGVGIMEDLHSLRVDEHKNELEIHHGAFKEMAAKSYDMRSMLIDPAGSNLPKHVASAAIPSRIRKVIVTRHRSIPLIGLLNHLTHFSKS